MKNFLLIQLSEYKDVVRTDDATVQGILLGIAIALGAVVVFLYRKNNEITKDMFNLQNEIRDLLIEQANKYNEFSNNMLKFQEYVRRERE